MNPPKNRLFVTLVIVYIFVCVALLLYSYTQVDLSLTLSKASFVQTVQKTFQQIGYYNRPVSAMVFIGITGALFSLYIWLIGAVKNKLITGSQVWKLIVIPVLLLLVSYPAFSYDFFNYLFTAKTVLIYHKNPYTVIPLDFTGIDPWLSFMHWTHLPSAYTPLWILTTLPAYIFGFGYLLTLMWSLKVVMAVAYLATIKGIEQILRHDHKSFEVLGMVIFAFNPLVIIETLVSPHNDILMMALVIWAIVLFREKKIWISWFVLASSVAMKLMTIFLIPAFFMKWNRKVSLICMCIGLGAVLSQREILPWYWLWVIPFVALLPEIEEISVISTGISLGLLLRYVPFLYLGNWDDPAPMMKFWAIGIPVAIAVGIVVIRFVWRRNSYIIKT